MRGFALWVSSSVIITHLHMGNSACKRATGWCTCCSWGHIDRREGFHTAVQLWPCGYEATWPESQLEGASYTSRIQPDEDAEGPSFTVTLRTSDGQEQVPLSLHSSRFIPRSRLVCIDHARYLLGTLRRDVKVTY
jgi:hypothetical protein